MPRAGATTGQRKRWQEAKQRTQERQALEKWGMLQPKSDEMKPAREDKP
jgi:hypothetical protein